MSVFGLVLLIGIVMTTAYRSWWLAADYQRGLDGAALPFAAATVLPLLLIVFAVVYVVAGTSTVVTTGLAASWLLFVLCAIKSKQDAHAVALPLATVSGSFRDLPLPDFGRPTGNDRRTRTA